MNKPIPGCSNAFYGLCLFAFGFSLALAGQSPARAPRLIVEKEVVDLGHLRPESFIDFEVRVANLGNADLVIENIDTTCGCTNVEMLHRKIAPGETSVLKVRYNANNHQGSLSRYITLFTNDPARQEQRITVKVKVHPDIYCEPDLAKLPWPLDVSYIGKFKVVAANGGPVEIKRVYSDSNSMKTEITGNPGQSPEVLYSYLPDTAYRNSDIIHVETNRADLDVSFQIFFQKTSMLVLSPQRVSIHAVRGEPSPERRISIRRRDGQPLKLLSVSPSQPYFKIKVEQNGPDVLILSITLEGRSLVGACDGYINIVTDVEEKNLNITCKVLRNDGSPEKATSR